MQLSLTYYLAPSTAVRIPFCAHWRRACTALSSGLAQPDFFLCIDENHGEPAVIDNETGQQCLLLTNTFSRYHITPTQTKPLGYEERNGMERVVILVFCVVIAK